MKNIKVKVISAVMASMFLIYAIPDIVKAEPITVNYTNDEGVQSVDIIELASALGENIENTDGNIKVNINGKIITFNENGSFIYIDGEVTALEVEEVEIIDSNDKYKLPLPKKIKNDKGLYLISRDIVEDYLGLECNDDGIIINKDDDSADTEINDSQEEVDNSIPVSNETLEESAAQVEGENSVPQEGENVESSELTEGQ